MLVVRQSTVSIRGHFAFVAAEDSRCTSKSCYMERVAWSGLHGAGCMERVNPMLTATCRAAVGSSEEIGMYLASSYLWPIARQVR